jgi:hypothetical protein
MARAKLELFWIFFYCIWGISLRKYMIAGQRGSSPPSRTREERCSSGPQHLVVGDDPLFHLRAQHLPAPHRGQRRQTELDFQMFITASGVLAGSSTPLWQDDPSNRGLSTMSLERRGMVLIAKRKGLDRLHTRCLLYSA